MGAGMSHLCAKNKWWGPRNEKSCWEARIQLDSSSTICYNLIKMEDR